MGDDWKSTLKCLAIQLTLEYNQIIGIMERWGMLSSHHLYRNTHLNFWYLQISNFIPFHSILSCCWTIHSFIVGRYNYHEFHNKWFFRFKYKVKTLHPTHGSTLIDSKNDIINQFANYPFRVWYPIKKIKLL